VALLAPWAVNCIIALFKLTFVILTLLIVGAGRVVKTCSAEVQGYRLGRPIVPVVISSASIKVLIVNE